MKKFQPFVYVLIALALLPIAYYAVENGQEKVAISVVIAFILLVLGLNNKDVIITTSHNKEGTSMTFQAKTPSAKKPKAKK